MVTWQSLIDPATAEAAAVGGGWLLARAPQPPVRR